jgi:hypothetical protein
MECKTYRKANEMKFQTQHFQNLNGLDGMSLPSLRADYISYDL